MFLLGKLVLLLKLTMILCFLRESPVELWTALGRNSQWTTQLELHSQKDQPLDHWTTGCRMPLDRVHLTFCH